MEQLVTACLELGVFDKKFIELSHQRCYGWRNLFFFSHFQQLESFVVNEIVMNPAGQHIHVFSPTPSDWSPMLMGTEAYATMPQTSTVDLARKILATMPGSPMAAL